MVAKAAVNEESIICNFIVILFRRGNVHAGNG